MMVDGERKKCSECSEVDGSVHPPSSVPCTKRAEPLVSKTKAPSTSRLRHSAQDDASGNVRQRRCLENQSAPMKLRTSTPASCNTRRISFAMEIAFGVSE